MKNQGLFAAFVVSLCLGCGTVASVKTRQSLPISAPDGCHQLDGGGNGESGNYSYVNGYSFDAGTYYVQIAYGNSLMTYACTDAAMQKNYADLYKTYMQAEFSQKDEKIEAEVKKTQAAVDKLGTAMVALSELVVKGSKAEDKAEADKGKKEEKKGKGGKTVEPVIVFTPPPAVSAVPAPVPPSQLGPALAARLRATQNKAEFINTLLGAASQDPTNADLFTRFANKASQSKDENFASDRDAIAKAIEGGSR